MSRRRTMRTLALLAVCALLLFAAGCAARRAPAPEPPPLSPSARLTYDYLLYLDQRTRLAMATQDDPQPGTPEFEEAIAIQRRAAGALDRVLEREPSPLLWGEKAALYFNPRQADRAIDIINKGLDRYPENPLLTGLLVNAYLLKSDREMASVILEQYSLTHPDDHEAIVRLANLLVEEEQYARALDQIARIPAEERDNGVLYLKARSESRLGNRAQARRTIAAILKSDPEHYEALTELAFIQELANEYDKAAETYQRLLELGGPEPEIRQRIITLNLKLNRVDTALKTALEGPDTKSFMLAAAALFLNQDFPAQASAVLDRLAGMDPVPPEYFFYKAVIAFDAEEDPEKALSFLDRIGPEDENHGQALLFRAQINMHLEREEEAMRLLDQGQEAYPQDPRFDRIKAEYLALKEDYAQAVEVLAGAIERHGDNPELLYQYGALLDMNGRREQAIAIMERILESHPEHAEALNYVGYTLAEEGRDLERALVLVQNAMRLKPDNGAITDSLAWVLFKLGRLEQAWEAINSAVALLETDPVIWEHYGDIALARGDSDIARDAYRRALELDSKNAEAIRKKLDSL